MNNVLTRCLLPAVALSAVLGGPLPIASGCGVELCYYSNLEPRKPLVIECDVAVYGGTPGGAAAAIQAARGGKKSVLLSFNRYVGGMISGGLTDTDIGRQESIGGLAAEFFSKAGAIKGFSPAKAESVLLEMLSQAGVRVLTDCRLQSSVMQGSRLVSVTMETGETVKAGMFVDATYEGDLLAAANVSYHVGREPVSAYGESLAGLWQKVSWDTVYQFCGLPVSPYKEPASSASGMLPEISAEPPGKQGEGDFKVQAYNFRMYLSSKEGRIPFPRPKGYDPGRYALLARFLNADPGLSWTLDYTTKPMTDGPVQVKEGDCNNAGSFSTDYVGGNYRWPDGTYVPGSFAKLPPPRRGTAMPWQELYQLREKIFQDHVNYQQGFMYFLANDPQVPEELRRRVSRFGLDPDEFKESGNWPIPLYVREGRRMVSDYVMTQADCESARTAEDSVGLASYNMDSHFCQRVVVVKYGKDVVRNEGAFGLRCPKPYPVAYRSIVPAKGECANLLVPVCLSSSHVAYGSIRMEPVFMILGQSAGMAASMAIDDGKAVQDVNYAKLRKQLLAAGQRL